MKNDSRGFRPSTYSQHEWNRLTREEKDEILKYHVDDKVIKHNPNADHVEASDTESEAEVAEDSDGIVDGDISLETPVPRPRITSSSRPPNEWRDNGDYWVYYRNNPKKGPVHPERSGLDSGPEASYSVLTGQRRTTATFQTDGGDPVERVLEDDWGVPNSHLFLEDPNDVESNEMIKNQPWTGIVEFKKVAPGADNSPPTGTSTSSSAPAPQSDDDGVVWWTPDDPSTNEGVEPPPEERNPFKITPIQDRSSTLYRPLGDRRLLIAAMKEKYYRRKKREYDIRHRPGKY